MAEVALLIQHELESIWSSREAAEEEAERRVAEMWAEGVPRVWVEIVETGEESE